MLVQVSRTGAHVLGSEESFAAARARFDADDVLVLRQLIEPAFLEQVLRELEKQGFRPADYAEMAGSELRMSPSTLGHMLLLALNRPQVLDSISRITGCAPLRCFIGRVYRMIPGAGHATDWHDDIADHRCVTMSVNLSAQPFEGGQLHIREARTGRILHEISNTGPGDAVIFRISDRFQHRVTSVEGRVAKTALAGWFCSQPTFVELLRDSLGQS